MMVPMRVLVLDFCAVLVAWSLNLFLFQTHSPGMNQFININTTIQSAILASLFVSVYCGLVSGLTVLLLKGTTGYSNFKKLYPIIFALVFFFTFSLLGAIALSPASHQNLYSNGAYLAIDGKLTEAGLQNIWRDFLFYCSTAVLLG